ncbi:sensor domain-containing protein [Streptomyces sp. NPDC005485]|uniref:sensor domain-containing protein n=1 Tax=Streptomyces sp. NPDC005485 TaxID=3155591 RepID=UPI0033B26FD3
MTATRNLQVRTPVRDTASLRAWRLVREPFTAGTWRRAGYALLALPVGVACVPLSLVGRSGGRRQRELVRRFLGVEVRGTGRGLVHALVATPLNLLVLAVTVYGWSIVPMNLGWPLRAGSDYSDAWGGPTFAGAWAFHAVVGGLGFLLIMPWVGRGMAAVQARLARALLS